MIPDMDMFNPLAHGDDDPFAEPADEAASLSIYVVDVARQDERRKLIAAMREGYSQKLARFRAAGFSTETAANEAMSLVLFGMDWVTEPLP